MTPLGLMGGTFDPPHFAHLRLAEEAREALGLGTVRWIPSGRPGHRDAPGTSAADRLEMVRCAIAGHPHFTLDETEARSTAPTYTVDTLGRLRAELGEAAPLVVIIGMDSALTLPTWRDWRRLFELAHFAVGARPGYDEDGALHPEVAARMAGAEALAAASAGAVVRFRSTLLDISASSIRAKIAHGASVRYLLPPQVLDYIGKQGLYRAA